jgi:hypothetical protein
MLHKISRTALEELNIERIHATLTQAIHDMRGYHDFNAPRTRDTGMRPLPRHQSETHQQGGGADGRRRTLRRVEGCHQNQCPPGNSAIRRRILSRTLRFVTAPKEAPHSGAFFVLPAVRGTGFEQPERVEYFDIKHARFYNES